MIEVLSCIEVDMDPCADLVGKIVSFHAGVQM